MIHFSILSIILQLILSLEKDAATENQKLHTSPVCSENVNITVTY